ncbi:MAG: AraC family transcriptional regulator [Clostridiales bacterium]|jgi:two-component system response regulator YesN|nr:AraC family transcriptional regulator [Clostridiales bacterium]
MNILIVDDDAYIIRSMRTQINWAGIGIDNVYTALNAEKAKDFLRRQPIDIMVTDIEMPQEDGFELMRWALEQGYRPESLCLTCHADFDYARNAISLGYSDYCVKPVQFKDLEKILDGIVKKCRGKHQQEAMAAEGALWESNKCVVASDFWLRLLQGRLSGQLADVQRAAAQKNIEYHFDRKYQCVLLAVCAIEGEDASGWMADGGLLQYALHNILCEKFQREGEQGMMGWSADHLWILIEDASYANLADEIQDYLNVCKSLFGVVLAAYMGKQVFSEELHGEYARLARLDMDNVMRAGGIYTLDKDALLAVRENRNDLFLEESAALMNQDDYGAFFDQAARYLKTAEPWNREQLESFAYNMLQLIFARMLSLGITADKLLDRELTRGLLLSYRSVDEMIACLNELKAKLLSLYQQQQQESKIINDIKAYVREHIESKFSRKDISDHVFFSQDYLTKLFRKKTGRTLIEYIIEEKVNAAKRMIGSEGIPIGETAQRLGYTNFSHFSKVFRKKTGMTPSEYKHLKNNNPN